MEIVKGILYVLAAIAVITFIAFGGFVIIFIGMVLGVLLSLISSVILTAGSLREYFRSKPKKSH